MKQKLHDSLSARLRQLGKKYGVPVTSEQNCTHIRELAVVLTSEFCNILKGGRFRIGIAQKALNLYLKYLWCLGWLPIPPPNCPLDRRIIDKLNLKDRNGLDWTKLDEMENYKKLIQKCRQIAGNISLAEWELKAWKF